MNQILKNILLTSFIFIIIQYSATAQLDSVMTECEKYLTDEYLSDGQQYLSLITGDQVAEFSVLFYGGNTYRIITCGGDTENSLIFIIYDKYRNVYYRVASIGLTDDEYRNDKRIKIKQTSVIILDENFNKIGETLFPRFEYTAQIAFVSPDGLCVGKYEKSMENEDFMYFGVLTLENNTDAE